MFWILYNLFMQNKDALISLPTEVKTIAMIAMIVCFGGSIIRKAWKLLEVVIVIAIVYFGATVLGFI